MTATGGGTLGAQTAHDSAYTDLPMTDSGVTASAVRPGAPTLPATPDTAADPLAAGIAAFEGRDPATALARFREAVALDSLSYEPNLRLALTLITLGQRVPDTRSDANRDSMYAEAERRARTAVRADTSRADGWFMLASAMGRSALTRPPQLRLKMARTIRAAAIRAITLNPSHDGAYHVLGRWHAEIMRLPGIERFFARRVLGAKVFDEASWDEATANLERAVALDTTRIVHRLDLAEVYADRKRYADARAQLDTLAAMPEREYLDPQHKAAADKLREKIANKQDS
ncbi:MAG TPA: hypothetical protein VFM14_15585 [Gemmatimonadales bacterium]|nr:hypothetical protein [Gemmatimonadales bacterium]